MTDEQLMGMARQIMAWEKAGMDDEDMDIKLAELGYTQEEIDAINDTYCEHYTELFIED